MPIYASSLFILIAAYFVPRPWSICTSAVGFSFICWMVYTYESFESIRIEMLRNGINIRIRDEELFIPWRDIKSVIEYDNALVITGPTEHEYMIFNPLLNYILLRSEIRDATGKPIRRLLGHP